MSVLQVINTVITVLYYGIAAFFLFALAKVFVKSQKVQPDYDAVYPAAAAAEVRR